MMSYWARLSHQKLDCGKSLLELSVFNGVALWWFNQMETFEAFNRVASEREGESHAERDLMGGPSRSVSLSTLQGTALQIGLGGLFGCANRLNRDPRLPNSSKGPILLVTHDAEWRSVYEPEQNRTVTTDRFFHPLAKELRSRGYVVCSVSTAVPPYLRSLTITSERGMKQFSRHYLIDGFTNAHGIVVRLEASAHFERIAGTIQDDPTLEGMLSEFGEKNVDRLKGILRFSLTKRYPDFVKRVEQAKQLLRKVKPSAVVIENEMGYFQRAVIAAGWTTGTITMALQHGEISLTNPSYLYQTEDVCDKGATRTCVPMPDLTLVYGPHYEDLLTNQSVFPNDRVAIIGNMQFDSIAHIERDKASRELRENLRIEHGVPLVLWTTQSHALSSAEFELVSKAMRDTLLALPEVQLIVKQHPMETSGHRQKLQDNLTPLGARVTFVSKEHDIMTLIAAADVVITKDSTTGLEAVAAKRPLIVLNLSGTEDRVDYVRQGAAVGVYRPDDLRLAIKDALDGQAVLGDRRELYVKRYLMALDGKAAKRAVDLIESIRAASTGERESGV